MNQPVSIINDFYTSELPMVDALFTEYAGHLTNQITVGSNAALTEAIQELLDGTGGTIHLDAAGGPYQIDEFNIGRAATPILFTSLDPDVPAEIDKIDLSNAAYLTFDNLSFVNTRAEADYTLSDFTIRVASSNHIEFTSNVMTGSATELALDESNNGGSLAMVTDSTDVAILGNTISRYFHGPTIVDSEFIEVQGNDISLMQGDGMRGGGLFEVSISDNVFHDFLGAVQEVTHNDMIQLWGRNVAVENRNIEIEGNVLHAGSGSATQGIFIRNETFGDGGPASSFFDNISITNNIIYNGRFQGITVRDTRNVIVENNTLLWNQDAAHLETPTADPLSVPPTILGTNLETFDFSQNISVQTIVNGEQLHTENFAVNYENSNAFEYVNFHIVNPDNGADATLVDLSLKSGSPFFGTFGANPDPESGGEDDETLIIDTVFGTDETTSFRLNGTSHIDYDEAPIAMAGVDTLTINLGFKLDTGPESGGYLLRVPGLLGLNVYDHGGFKFRLVTEDGAFQVQAPLGTLSDGLFHDINIEFDSNIGTLSLFVDGVLVQEVAASGATIDASNQDVILGQSFGSAAEGFVQYFSVAVPEADNADPVADNLFVAGPEDTVFAGNLTAVDPDGDPLAFALTSEPFNGTVSLSEDGSFTYTPPDNFFGEESFSYLVTDGNGGSDAGVVNLSVTSVNDAPVITSEMLIEAPENSITLPAVTATDIDSAELSYVITGGEDAGLFTINPTSGALAFNASPDFESPLDANFDNIYEVEVSATDGIDATSSNITVSVTDVSETVTGPDDIIDLFIFNKSTDELVTPLEDGDALDLSLFEGYEATIVAFVNGSSDLAGSVGSIKMNFQDGLINRTETASPYALFGDNGAGNFYGGIELVEGSYTLELDLFSGPRGQGSLLEEVDYAFSIISTPPTTPSDPPPDDTDPMDEDDDIGLMDEVDDDDPVEEDDIDLMNDDDGLDPEEQDDDIGLMDDDDVMDPVEDDVTDPVEEDDIMNPVEEDDVVEDDIDLMDEDDAEVSNDGLLNLFIVDTADDTVFSTLANGDSFEFASVDGEMFSIFAEVNPETTLDIGSVVMEFDNGSIIKTENLTPYSLFGDNGAGTFFGGVEFAAQSYDLTLDVYAGPNGTGELLDEIVLNFDVIDNSLG